VQLEALILSFFPVGSRHRTGFYSFWQNASISNDWHLI